MDAYTGDEFERRPQKPPQKEEWNYGTYDPGIKDWKPTPPPSAYESLEHQSRHKLLVARARAIALQAKQAKPGEHCPARQHIAALGGPLRKDVVYRTRPGIERVEAMMRYFDHLRLSTLVHSIALTFF